MDTDIQQPPRNIEAEKAVLGSIMLDSDVIVEVDGVISSGDFYQTNHSKLYDIMQKLYDEDKPIDTVTVYDKVIEAGLQEHIDGSYLSSILNFVPTSSNAKYYAELVKDASKKRKAIRLGQKIKDLGYSDKSSLEILEEAEKLMSELQSDKESDKIFKFGDTLMQYTDELQKRKESGGLVGLPWKWDSLNNLTGGLKPQNLIIVGARPSMGKTAFSLDTAKHIAKQGIPTGIFSLEMSDFELKDRTFASETNINGLDLARGTFGDEDWGRITKAAGELSELPIYMSKPSLNKISEIKNEARKLHRKHGIKLLLVDYLQLVTGADEGNRNLDVQEISRTFKQIARELDIPVVVLAQLSRAVEQRNNKKPMLSDLRDSGSIEQDADLVIFLYRDEYYNKDTEKAGILETIIGKQRNGPTDTVDLVFLKEFQRIEEISRRG